MLRSLYLIVILYFFLYNPIFLAFGGIGSFKLILVISLLYAIAKPKSFLLLKKFKLEALFVFILMIYFFINSSRTLVGLFELPYLSLIWFFENIIFPVVLIFFFKNELKKYGLENFLVITGTLASFVSVVLLLNPDWNHFVRNSLIVYSGVDLDAYHEIRGFGIAESLFGSYAMIQGIILGMCFYLARRNILFAIPMLPMLASIAFNARTGLFAIPVSVLLLLFTEKFSNRLNATLGFLFLFIVYLYNSNRLFIEIYVPTVDWIFAGYDEVLASFEGEYNNSTGTILQEETFIPNNIFEFVFGAAQYGPINTTVDNGFFYTLWYGGALNMLLQLSFIGFMFYRLWRIDKKKYIILLLFVLLLLYNLKWHYLFVPSGISRLIGIYYVWNIWSFYNRKGEQRINKNLEVGGIENFI